MRGSCGVTGSDQITDYQFLSQYNPYSTQVPYQNTIGFSPSGIPNPYIEWEKTRKLSLGVELGFFADKIFLNATYGRNRSSNQLLQTSLPSTTGVQSVIQNLSATVQNVNWEFTLRTENIQSKNFTWSTSLNLTIPFNKVFAFGDIENTYYHQYDSYGVVIGQPLGVTKLYHFLGVDPATGLYLVADRNGKPTSEPDYNVDRSVFMSRLPKFYGGLQNSIRYKTFEFDVLFRFVRQTAGPATSYSSVPGQFSHHVSSGNQPVDVLDRWQKPGDNARFTKFTASIYPPANYYLKNGVSDAALVDGSFIRLQNVSISWEFPGTWRQKMHFQKCRLYLQAQNLLTISNYKGYDPDIQDAGTMPPLRTLTLGLQVGL